MPSLNSTTLVIVAKRPMPGHGKQRLASTLGEESACEIAQQLFACTVDDGLNWPGPKILAISDKSSLDWAKNQVPKDWTVLAQTTGNLGQRLNAIDSQARDLNHQKLVYIGTDCPVMTTNYLMNVSDKLKEYDCVLGYAQDGGVVVMANSQPWPNLEKLAWSTNILGTELANAINQNSYSLGFVETLYDIDTQDDLHKLLRDLTQDNRASRKKLLKLLTQMISFN